MFSLIKLYKALLYSWAGITAAFRAERAFRQEVVLAAILIPVALWLGRTGADKALMVSSVLLVLIIELLNTAVETLVERISSERHALSGRAKDVGSAAVFVSLLNVVLVWSLVLFG